MTLRTTLVLSCALAVGVLGAQTVSHPIPPGAGVIAGRVIDAVTKQPVANANVWLAPLGTYGTWSPATTADPRRQAKTGDDGTFRFTSVGPIEFQVTVSRAGYSDGGFGKRRPAGTVAPLKLEQDEHVEDLSIALWPIGPSSVISGTVVDEGGRPAADVRVLMFHWPPSDPGTRAQSSGGMTTDDHGTYRISIGTPGRYIVCVQPFYTYLPIPPLSQQQRLVPATDMPAGRGVPVLIDHDGRNLVELSYLLTPPPPFADGRLSMYVPSCAPGATTLAEARIVDLAAGAPQDHVDLKLQLRPAVRVAGRLTGPDGPIGNAWVRLLPADWSGVDRYTMALSTPDGAFTFMMVPVGTYRVEISVPSTPSSVTPSASGFPSVYHPDYGPADTKGFSIAAPLVVGEKDLDSVLLTARPGVTVSGSTGFDANVPVTAAQLSRVSVSLTDAGMDPGGTSSRATTPGRFAIAGVKPGRYAISARGPEGWYFVSASHAGRDITDAPVDVGAEDITDLLVMFTAQPTEVSGLVWDARFQLVRDATVVIYPVDRALRATFGSRPLRVRTTRASSGRYAFVGLPPGDYFVAAVDDATMDPWPDAKFLTTLEAGATQVTLGRSDHQTVDLGWTGGR